MSTERSLSASLDGTDDGTERVYLCGESPVVRGSDLLNWATLPPGWAHDETGHYLSTAAPIFRLRRPDGRRVEVHRAAAWFGDDVAPAAAAEAAGQLAGELAGRFDGAVLLSTPATTGRELVARSLPPGDWPTLTDEHQDMIRSTSGQGRIQTWPLGGQLDELHEYDGRFMYAALCWGLGAGPAVHDDRPDWEPRARGRYRVRFTPPAGWCHPVGLLPVLDGGAWTWPTSGTWETWADGAELHQADRLGWSFEILERLLLVDSKADPLGKWAKRLTAAREASSSPAVRAGLRSILLHGLGALHGRPSIVTRLTPVDSGDALPDDARILRVDGGHIVWETGHDRPAWPAMAHPEWTSAVWARARCRLVDHQGVGALHVPPAELVAVRTDAIYTTRRRPEWDQADDGKPGRFRHVWETENVPAPVNATDLITIKGDP